MRYVFRQRVMSVGDAYVLADESGHEVMRAASPALRLRDRFVVEDERGRCVATLSTRIFGMGQRFDVEVGGLAGVVRKRGFSWFAWRFDVEGAGLDGLSVSGNFADSVCWVKWVRGGVERVVARMQRADLSLTPEFAVTMFEDAEPGDLGLVALMGIVVDQG